MFHRALLFALFCVILHLNSAYGKKPVPIPPENPNDPPMLPSGTSRNVLVIGGGLAGLSAGTK